MSNETDLVTSSVEQLAAKPINRRKVVAGMAVAPIATSAIGGVAAPAMAATIDPSDARINAYKGQYALSGGKIIDGYFAQPRGKTNLNVVLVMPKGNALDAETENEVRRHALAGYLAIAPDLKATGGALSLAGRDAMIADMMTALPGLKKMAHGNGHLRIVGAEG
ncbi:MAG: hypothetical protein V4564_11035 [Pseudomonadota bacterium]